MANTPELCAHVESLAGRSDVLRAQGVRLELVRCAPTADWVALCCRRNGGIDAALDAQASARLV